MPILLTIAITSFAASLLTFFSGFGLGTLLMPVFALFFPLELAVALTGVVHLFRGIFKLMLVWKYVDWPIIRKFGIASIAGALAGAAALTQLSILPAHWTYAIGPYAFTTTPLKVLMALLIFSFGLFESLPRFQTIRIPASYLPFGGLLSGFFGGLSGHQGALRSLFLLRTRLSAPAYIATGAVIASLIDISRITVYFTHFTTAALQTQLPLLTLSIASAGLGIYIGSKAMKSVKLQTINTLIFILITAIAIGLMLGII